MKTMKTKSPLLLGFARGLTVAGLSSAAFLACSSEPPPEPKPGGAGLAGTASGGSSAGTASGGSATSAGTTSTAGTSSAGTASAGTSSAGTGGSTAGGGSSTGGTSTGGSGGGSSNGGAGGGALTAKATITATTGNTIAGTATFVDTAGIIKLTLAISAGCPPGAHDFHLHANAACGHDGNDAGGHWIPKGEGLGALTCSADGTGMATFTTPSAGYWTIGGSAATDLTMHAIMVHAAEPMATARIGCGVPVKQ